MFDSLTIICDIKTEGFSDQITEIQNDWIKQSSLIYLLENSLSTNSQKQKAADELGRLVFDKAKPGGYWNHDYSTQNYAQ